MTTVTLNPEQQLYVLNHGDGYTCFGFANARDHTNQIAQRLDRSDLAFGADDFGAIRGYEKYLSAVKAWGLSPRTQQTYFDPGTSPKVAKVLERCRNNRAKVRLIQGDPSTGRSWLDEHDVVGTIGRSMGTLKVPLLIEPEEHGGSAILTACLLGIVDWETGEFLFRHPAYRTPDLSIRRRDLADLPWEVHHAGGVVSRFSEIGKAGAYVAFMCGETIEPRIFQ
ncbi:hypothetical protein [Ottowia sp.]|uniref:hypothetical protein n=1 Tax=Ottowia sp. TaxID=1898956 RepID=UPI0026115011|nr:hypothetical protein [Ottowia sp.]